MAIWDRFLGKKEGADVQAGEAQPPSDNQPATVHYKGYDVTVKPQDQGLIRVERVANGKHAKDTFFELFELLRDRMDIGLTENDRIPNRGRRSNTVSGNLDWVILGDTNAIAVKLAIEKLHAEERDKIHITYQGVEMAIDAVGGASPAVTLTKLSDGKAEIFVALAKSLHERQDLGLPVNPDFKGAGGTSVNRVSAGDDKIWVNGGTMEAVAMAVEALDKEKQTETGTAKQKKGAGEASEAAADKKPRKPKKPKEKPEPSVEAVIRALRQKKGKKLPADVVARLENVMKRADEDGVSPPALLKEKDVFEGMGISIASRKALERAVSEVYPQDRAR